MTEEQDSYAKVHNMLAQKFSHGFEYARRSSEYGRIKADDGQCWDYWVEDGELQVSVYPHGR